MKSHAAVALDAASGRRLAETSVGSDAAGCEALARLGARPRRRAPHRRSRTAATSPAASSAGCCRAASASCACRRSSWPSARASARTPGKSDPIDAECVARAALREPQPARGAPRRARADVRLLADHRDDLVGERKRAQSTPALAPARPGARPRAAAAGARPLRLARPRRGAPARPWRRACACASPSSWSRAAAS